MGFKLAVKMVAVAGLASLIAISCAPKKKTKTPVTKADGSATKGAPSAETIEKVLAQALGASYKVGDENNKRASLRLAGATLKMGEVVVNKEGDTAAAEVEVKALLNNPVEAVVGKGEIRSSSKLGSLDIADNCGRKTEGFAIEALCLGKSCDNVLAMIRVKSEGDGEIALLFRRVAPEKTHALVWSSSERGEIKTSGRTESAEKALEAITEGQRAGEAVKINSQNMNCAPPDEAPAAPAPAPQKSADAVVDDADAKDGAAGGSKDKSKAEEGDSREDGTKENGAKAAVAEPAPEAGA